MLFFRNDQSAFWGYSSYGASKFALRGLAQALNNEVREDLEIIRHEYMPMSAFSRVLRCHSCGIGHKVSFLIVAKLIVRCLCMV